MNKLEKIYKEIKEKDDIEKTSIICSNLFIQTDYNFRVFISISIPIMTAYDPYNNESLVMTLNVEKNGQIEKWLEMKKSSLIGGGFGVFAARDFSAEEFVTVYLGKKFDLTYRFRDILALPSNFKLSGFQEEYWFGHRINHGSGRKKIWKLRMLMCYEPRKESKQEMNYFGTTTVTVFAGFVKKTPSFELKKCLHLINVVIVK
jgi:hypothetical protein